MLSTSAIDEYLAQALALWRRIYSEDSGLGASDHELSSIKGLWIVSLYAALEYAANSLVTQSLSHIENTGVKYGECRLELQPILHRSRVQSIRDCATSKSHSAAFDFIMATSSPQEIRRVGHPLSEVLQNVDGHSIQLIAQLFGISDYRIDKAALIKLNNLKERRNAVSHGRETAAQAGQNFNLKSMKDIYDVTDYEIQRLAKRLTRFLSTNEYLRR